MTKATDGPSSKPLKRREGTCAALKPYEPSDPFLDDELDDFDFLAAGEQLLFPLILLTAKADAEFVSIDDLCFNNTSDSKASTAPVADIADNAASTRVADSPRLESGKWACNHKCKDKTR